jgi:hypothetical protein
MLTNLSPKLTPGVLESTMKPVILLPAEAVLSVTAKTNNQLETPALVIQILDPLMTLREEEREQDKQREGGQRDSW